MPPICTVYRLGLIAYRDAWALQERLAAQIAAGAQPATLLLLEHPHVFTFGRRGQADNLLWDAAECARRDVTVEWVDRGGDVTYHGPGQLVGYPLLPLAPGGLYTLPAPPPSAADAEDAAPRLPQADYVGYVRRLEQMLIAALLRLGVRAVALPGLTGVWVQPPEPSPPAKLAAIGVKVDARGVSRHGFALNVAPDMRYWQGIIGCGLKDSPIASLAGLLAVPPSMPQVEAAVVQAFGDVFGYVMKAQDDRY